MDNPGSLKKHFGKYYSQLPKNVVSSTSLILTVPASRPTHEEATVVVIDAIGEWDTHYNMGR